MLDESSGTSDWLLVTRRNKAARHRKIDMNLKNKAAASSAAARSVKEKVENNND
jgi:hypothetical protein